MCCRVSTFQHSNIPTFRSGCPQPVLLRQSPLVGHSARCRPHRRVGARRHDRGRVARRLRAHRAARAAASGPLLLPFAVRSSVARPVRAAPRQHRQSVDARQHQSRSHCPQRSHRRHRFPARLSARSWDHRLSRHGRQYSRAQRQRRRDQRHVRRGRARRNHGGPERHPRVRVRSLTGVALHGGWARRAVERAQDGEPAHGHHVSVAGGPGRPGPGTQVNDPIRVGVLGAGAIAQVAHLPVLRRLPGVEVAAICDNDVGKAQALASRFEVKDTYDDIEEVLRYANVDVVVICTPNHLHEIHVTSALAAGTHVLCERPLALTLAGIERALAASDRYGKRVMVGMNHRFRSDVQAVRGFLAGGDLGALQAVRGGWYTFQPSRQLLGWRLRREQAGGGAVLDLGLPLIDLGLWLAGWPTPKRISAHLTRSSKDAVEDMGSALIVCENGVSITVDVSWRHLGQGERFWFDIVGAKGSAMIQPLRIFKEQHGAAVDVTPTGATGRETQFIQSYRAEWMYFLAVIKGDVNSPPPRDQLALQRVLDAIYRSADEGRDVLL